MMVRGSLAAARASEAGAMATLMVAAMARAAAAMAAEAMARVEAALVGAAAATRVAYRRAAEETVASCWDLAVSAGGVEAAMEPAANLAATAVEAVLVERAHRCTVHTRSIE